MPTERYIVFLFDDMHLAASDLLQVQKAATKMLAGSLADSDMAAVLSFSGVNSGMTRDHAKLQDAIAKIKVQSLYRRSGRECPDVDYYQADLIQNKHNDQAFQSRWTTHSIAGTWICVIWPSKWREPQPVAHLRLAIRMFA